MSDSTPAILLSCSLFIFPSKISHFSGKGKYLKKKRIYKIVLRTELLMRYVVSIYALSITNIIAWLNSVMLKLLHIAVIGRGVI